MLFCSVCGALQLPRASALQPRCMLRVLSRQLLVSGAFTASQCSAAGMGSLAHGSDAAQEPFQVLFCGEEFPWSYRFTKEALQDDPGFQVGRQGHLLGKSRLQLNRLAT